MRSNRPIRARRGAVVGVVHYSDQGTQYLSMRYTDRLADSGMASSIGSRGDAYDNALAESVIGLFKTEVIRRQGHWRSLEAVELATLTRVDWFNTRRLLEPIGCVPPAEFEAQYYEMVAVAWTQSTRPLTFPVRFTWPKSRLLRPASIKRRKSPGAWRASQAKA